MKKNLLAITIASVLCGMTATPAFAVTERGPVLVDLSKYTEHRRDTLIQGRKFSFLKLNYGDQLEQLAVDEKGNLLEPEEVLKLNREQYTKYGHIHPHLYRQMKQGKSDLFDVLVWLNIEPITQMSKPTEVREGDEKEYEASLAREYQNHLKRFHRDRSAVLEKLGLSPIAEKGMENTPFVRMSLTREEIKGMGWSALVQMVMPYDSKGVDDLDDSMAIANADDVHSAGITGYGVKVAVFENSPTSTTNLDIEDSYSSFAGIVPIYSDHAQNVTAIIKNLNAVSGFAPDALTYSANSKDIAALDWAVDTIRVSALNQSFHRSAEINDGLSTDDLYKDYKVLHYPWPTVVHAAGNWCSVGSSCYESGSDVTDEYVNHKGFNTISIGNHNDDASEMRASSCFINPNSAHGDRELPELSANGVSVTADGITKSGTSMSSPAVTGSVALLQETNSTLKYWPEGVRALLFAGSTTNVPDHAGQLSGGGDAANAPNYWWRDVSLNHDGFDGVGALNIEESVKIAQDRWNGEAAERGWDIGRMRSDDFNRSGWYERTYEVKAKPSSILAMRPHIRVALAWNSTATVDNSSAAAVYASELGMDLDVRVYDSSGAQVAYSLSWDNSYEVVDFDAKWGETYTIKVHRWSTEPNAWSWFGIAWDTHWKPLGLVIRPQTNVPAFRTR